MSNEEKLQEVEVKESKKVEAPQSEAPTLQEKEWYKELWEFIPKALYEFVGIFFFATCICWTNGNVNHWVFGFWVVLTFFGNYSGAHVNPAITIGFYIYDGKWVLGLIKLALYWTAQIFGAYLAGLVAFLFTHKGVFIGIPYENLMKHHIHIGLWGMLVTELIFTGTFLFIILYVCSPITGPKNSNPAIRMAVVIGWFYCAVLMGAPITGAAYNPALILSLNFLEYRRGNILAMAFVFPLIIAELLGAIIFALLFKWIFEYFHPNKDEMVKMKYELDLKVQEDAKRNQV